MIISLSHFFQSGIVKSVIWARFSFFVSFYRLSFGKRFKLKDSDVNGLSFFSLSIVVGRCNVAFNAALPSLIFSSSLLAALVLDFLSFLPD